MSCCEAPPPAWANQFNRRRAVRELRDYRRRGPIPTTKALIGALVRMGVGQSTLLDIGGGVGAIQIELLAAGARAATSVDAASSYQDIARVEAERRGVTDRITYLLGDFVELASEVSTADIVTLDRVVCCYAHMEPLLRLSAERCRRLYGLVYPRERWLAHAVVGVENAFRRLVRNPFRSFIHSVEAMDELIRSLGFTLRHKLRTLAWEVVIYERNR